MKTRLLIMLLCAVLLFSACQTETGPYDQSDERFQPETADITVNAFEGVTLTGKEITVNGDEVRLEAIWKNDTDYEVLYGEVFFVQKYVDGKWTVCDSGESNAFHSIAISLEPRSEHTKSYGVSNYYKIDEIGKYRLVTEFNVTLSEEVTKQCTVAAEFEKTENGYTVPEYRQSSPNVEIFDGKMPPNVNMLLNNVYLKGNQFGYSWNCTTDGELWEAVTTDTLHPLQVNDLKLQNTVSIQSAVLIFKDDPESVEVSYWSDDCIGNTDAPETKLELSSIAPDKYIFELQKGSNIYYVKATFKEEKYYGSVDYVFYVKADPFVLNSSGDYKYEDEGRDAQLRLAVDLFKSMSRQSEYKNVLISPTSIQLALAMTANGAKGQTREEMQALLGGKMTVEELNVFLNSYVASLPSDEKFKLHIANSIWFRDEEDRLTVNRSFLEKNAEYYGAQIFKKNFNDSQTVKDINGWVDENTDGMIDKIIDGISQDTVMYLINALCFDAEWDRQYDLSEIRQGNFKNVFMETKKVDMMHSEEGNYIETSDAKGFLKYYKDKKYAFVALLPNENDINGYIDSLTPQYIGSALNSVKKANGFATMPKFSYEYELTMNEVLCSLGMPTAFDASKADFTDMAISERGNIFIGNVLHKTFIQVDELGTKAGAVTKVEMWDECAPMYEWEITLDRPFVYMIIECENNTPIFMGALTDVEANA